MWSKHWGRNVSHHSGWLPVLQRRAPNKDTQLLDAQAVALQHALGSKAISLLCNCFFLPPKLSCHDCHLRSLRLAEGKVAEQGVEGVET